MILIIINNNFEFIILIKIIKKILLKIINKYKNNKKNKN